MNILLSTRFRRTFGGVLFGGISGALGGYVIGSWVSPKKVREYTRRGALGCATSLGTYSAIEREDAFIPFFALVGAACVPLAAIAGVTALVKR